VGGQRPRLLQILLLLETRHLHTSKPFAFEDLFQNLALVAGEVHRLLPLAHLQGGRFEQILKVSMCVEGLNRRETCGSFKLLLSSRHQGAAT
jgi:hypothetical protein